MGQPLAYAEHILAGFLEISLIQDVEGLMRPRKKWPISSATSCMDKLKQTPHRKTPVLVRIESTNCK